MPIQITKTDELRPGDFYEDCAGHPCLCTNVDPEIDEVNGISLIDGSYPRGCGVVGCGVRKLTLKEALLWRFFGPLDTPRDSRPDYVKTSGNAPLWLIPEDGKAP
jgi:hypothetical protein